VSDWVDLVNGGGAAVVGVAGIVGTYFGGRAATREARHHARLEGIYEGLVQFLTDLGRRVQAAQDGVHQGLTDEQVADLADRFSLLVAKLQLYSGEEVYGRIGLLVDTIEPLTQMLRGPVGPGEYDPEMRRLAASFDENMSHLIREMRRELALPVPRRRPRWLRKRR
jgi:hypothetical protein